MTEFKIGDEVEVLYTGDTCNLFYLGFYKSGMKGKIIDISQKGKQVRLSNDNNNIRETWLAIKSLKLVEPQYPNPPLPHCEVRIAFAKGANIESKHKDNVTWWDDEKPKWLPELKYRVKVEKTKDNLRIEELEQRIAEDMRVLDKHKKELAELKPTVHY
jgi:hypothetical protein